MKQKGFSPIIILGVVAIVALVAAGYYFLKMSGGFRVTTQVPTNTSSKEMGEEVSDSADSDTLGKEIDATELNSTNSDFSELDSSASSL